MSKFFSSPQMHARWQHQIPYIPIGLRFETLKLVTNPPPPPGNGNFSSGLDLENLRLAFESWCLTPHPPPPKKWKFQLKTGLKKFEVGFWKLVPDPPNTLMEEGEYPLPRSRLGGGGVPLPMARWGVPLPLPPGWTWEGVLPPLTWTLEGGTPN